MVLASHICNSIKSDSMRISRDFPRWEDAGRLVSFGLPIVREIASVGDQKTGHGYPPDRFEH
eukprot:1096290-Pyramimonas_sp.AAC.1